MAKLGGVIVASLFLANIAFADQAFLLKCGSLLKVQEGQVLTSQAILVKDGNTETRAAN